MKVRKWLSPIRFYPYAKWVSFTACVKNAGLRVLKLAFFLVLSLATPASFAVLVPPADDDIEAQIEFIDQEILILRAELAQSQQNVTLLREYVLQLESMRLHHLFQPRLEQLKGYLQKAPSKAQTPVFQWPSGDSQVVLLLPLSGRYEQVGNAILESFQQAWPWSKGLTVIDSALYDSIQELASLVKAYDPDFIIGPLQKNRILAWRNLPLNIPSLYLNPVQSLSSHERALDMGKTAGIQAVAELASELSITRLAVLQEHGVQADYAERLRQQLWEHSGLVVRVHDIRYQSDAQAEVKALLNIERSFARKNWVQKTVGEDLVFTPRARQDLQAVVQYLPLEAVQQTNPLLRFYQQGQLLNIWQPSQQASVPSLQNFRITWPEFYAFLPDYWLTLNDVESPQSSQQAARFKWNNQMKSKNGLFYALGRMAAELTVVHAQQTDVYSDIELPIGSVKWDKTGVARLMPKAYYLNGKRIESIHTD